MELSWHQHLYHSNKKLYKNGDLVDITKQQFQEINSVLKHTQLKKINRPFFIFNGSHNIQFPTLNSVSKSTAFFFFEPLTYYNSNRKGYCDHILRTDCTDNVRAYELDSVKEFIQQHNINDASVFIPDRYAAEYFEKIYNLNCKWYDPYFDVQCKYLDTVGRFIPHSYYTKKISKKLWCGTWRYDPVRHYILAELVEKNLHQNNNFSWFYSVPTDKIKDTLWFEADQTQLERLKKINHIEALNMDTDALQLIDYENVYPKQHTNTKDPLHYYQQCFCAMVVETRVVQPWVNLSEKTLFAIKNRRPFLLYAAPGTLTTLNAMGIKTFSNYWDESYDNIIDSVERIHAINQIAEQINSMDMHCLKSMYQDMKSILLHNLYTVKNIHQLAKYY